MHPAFSLQNLIAKDCREVEDLISYNTTAQPILIAVDIQLYFVAI